LGDQKWTEEPFYQSLPHLEPRSDGLAGRRQVHDWNGANAAIYTPKVWRREIPTSIASCCGRAVRMMGAPHAGLYMSRLLSTPSFIPLCRPFVLQWVWRQTGLAGC